MIKFYIFRYAARFDLHAVIYLDSGVFCVSATPDIHWSIVDNCMHSRTGGHDIHNRITSIQCNIICGILAMTCCPAAGSVINTAVLAGESNISSVGYCYTTIQRVPIYIQCTAAGINI